jgi:RHS repeat-associated protein
MNPDATIAHDSNGMYGDATSNGEYNVGAYFAMPPGNSWKIYFTGNNLKGIQVAQGDESPTAETKLDEIVAPAQNKTYWITKPYVEIQWTISAPIELAATPVFHAFCYSAFAPTATRTPTATFTATLTPKPMSWRTYTLNADFDEGASFNLTHDPDDQLQLFDHPQQFGFIWVAVSTKGTVVKINTETGAIMGEYWTSPNGQPKNPSRTTVDLNGNVWAANRDGNSVTHIGLIENGQCVDRNGNGTIDTSTGLNDIRAWSNDGGADTNGGVTTAQDECVIHYVRVNSSGTRHVSVNSNNDVWVSGTGGQNFDLLDGETGQIIRSETSVGYGGYGGLIDGNGVVWSARPLLRWDTSNPLTGPNGGNWTGYGHDSYGLCIDGQGNIWNTALYGNAIHKFTPDGALVGTYQHGYGSAQGCVADKNGDIWVAHVLWGDPSVGHLKNDGTFVGNVPVPSGPTGVAVDANGKIWATNYYSRNVSRIDPNAGPIGLDGETHVGEVDFTTVDLGGNPYNYSDMTGSTLTGLPENGQWSFVFDSQIAGAEWGTASWFASVPGDGSLTVAVASGEDGIHFGASESAVNGQDLGVSNGRYLKVVVDFHRASSGESPVLYDLTVGTAGYSPEPTPIYTPTKAATSTQSPSPTPTGDTPTPSNTPTATATFTPTATSTATFTPTPTTPPLESLDIPGWIAAPENQSAVTGIVPIKLVEGVTLVEGTIDYWPATDLTQVTTLADVSSLGGATLATNLSASGGETLAYLDTTLLSNDSYVIRLRGTNSEGVQKSSGVLITVYGEYKPGRVRFTITDLTVPVVGLPIVVGRTYDSLERNRVGDFGNGWSLAIGNPRLEMDNAKNVTLTMPDGKRVTFYFTPESYGGVFGFFFHPKYTPEAGVYGSLTVPDCVVVISGGQYYCFLEGDYDPAEYTYTDPYGRKFVMDRDGTLKTITDLNDNVLTFTPEGITSSAGDIHVDFARDSEGRITQITGPDNKVYKYKYDSNGDLESVTLPSVTLPDNTKQDVILTYSYYDDHFFKEAFDPRGNRPVITTYDTSGRLETVTDSAGSVTKYSYDLDTHTTTVSYLGDPDDPSDDLGSAVMVYDEAGNLLSYTNPQQETTSFSYNEKNKLTLVSDPLAHETKYAYNSDGHPISIIDPLQNTIASAQYNKYGGPTSLTSSAPGGSTTIAYDPVTFMPLSASDDLGFLGSYTWTDHGNPETMTNSAGETTSYTYTPQGYVETVTDPLGHITHYVYDLFGRVTDMTVAYNTSDAMTVHYKYDELGRLTDTTTAYGTPLAATTHYDYDPNGNLIAVTDPLNRRVEYKYDNADRLIFEIHAAHAPAESTTTKYDYDSFGRLTDTTIAYGTADAVTTHYEYDSVGRKVNVIVAYGTSSASTTHYAYDAAGRMTDVTIAYGTSSSSTTHYVYDAAGRTTDVTTAYGFPEASTAHYEYYPSGLLKSVTTAYGTPLAATTHYDYDSRGRPTLTQFADGTTVSQSYDPLPNTPGWVNSTTDQAGVRTDYLYDAAGRLEKLIVSATDPQTHQTFHQTSRYEYDFANRLVASFDPLNNRATSEYNDAGQLIASTAWLNDTTGFTTHYEYDLAGQMKSITDPNGHITKFFYDELGRQQQTVYPGNVTTSQTYNAAGQRLTSTDENGIVTRYQYNPIGQLSMVTLADGTADAASVSYGYNAAGQLISITDPLSRVTSFEYNHAGQQIRKTLPDLSFEEFAYNAAGNRVSHRLTDGNVNVFAYDNMSRLIQANYYDGKTITFSYTDGGARQSASIQPAPLAPAQTYFYSYDAFQRLKQITNPDGRSVFYAYNDANQRTEMITPADTIHYSYDGLGRLASVSNGSPAKTTTFEYDPVGRLIEKKLPNGITTSYAYNERNQLTGITHSNSSGVQQSFAYTLDKAGNRKSVTEADGSSIQWTYDNLYRLTNETRFNSSSAMIAQASFVYDLAGNRLSQNINGNTTNYTYNELDQLLSAGSKQYEYDDRGNLTKVTDGTNVATYEYDSTNRQVNATMPDGKTIANVYDMDGRRIQQSMDSETTDYLWDTTSLYGDVILETQGTNETSYLLAGTELISQTRNGVASYYLQDGQGSTRALTNNAGSITDSYAYTAFGEIYSQTGSTQNSYLYTGQQYDDATGLYNLRARYYNPALGRFLSQDTYPVNVGNPIELNRYGYARGNPVNYGDPSGLFALASSAGTYRPAIQSMPALITFSVFVTNVVMVSAIALLLFAGVMWLVDAPTRPNDTDLSNEWEQMIQEAWFFGGGDGGGNPIKDLAILVFSLLVLAIIGGIADATSQGSDQDIETKEDEEALKSIVLDLGPSNNYEGEIRPLIMMYGGGARIVGVDEYDDYLVRSQTANLVPPILMPDQYDYIQANFVHIENIRRTLAARKYPSCATATYSLWPSTNVPDTNSLIIAIGSLTCSGGAFFVASDSPYTIRTISEFLGGQVGETTSQCLATPSCSPVGIGFWSDASYAKGDVYYFLGVKY